MYVQAGEQVGHKAHTLQMLNEKWVMRSTHLLDVMNTPKVFRLLVYKKTPQGSFRERLFQHCQMLKRGSDRLTPTHQTASYSHPLEILNIKRWIRGPLNTCEILKLGLDYFEGENNLDGTSF